MNCTKNGLLPISLPQAARNELAKIAPNQTITVDLPNQKVINRATAYSF